MRTKEEILNMLADILKNKYQLEEKYKSLHQIDRLSGEGNQLIENINKFEGKIQALKWVLNISIS